MNRSPLWLARRERLMKWWAPARFGLFYHYGLFTGGGCSVRESAGYPGTALKYPTAEAFDAATPAPEAVAANLCDAAVRAGARYVILTALHSGESMCVLFPTRNPAYNYKTRKDYVGAFLDAAHARGLKAELYFPMGIGEWDVVDPPMLAEGARDAPGYFAAFRELLREMRERYGDRIDGFWLDGRPDTPERAALPAFVKSLWPDAILTSNGDGELWVDEMDVGTSEEYEEEPSPPYNRWSAYRRNGRWGSTPPRRDFNEDIPHVGKGYYWWWGGEGSTDERYTSDRFFLLRQMVACVGQRGMWNFAPGIAPLVDGSMPAEIQPSLDAIRDFLAWGSEAVFGTQGGERSVLTGAHQGLRALRERRLRPEEDHRPAHRRRTAVPDVGLRPLPRGRRLVRRRPLRRQGPRLRVLAAAPPFLRPLPHPNTPPYTMIPVAIHLTQRDSANLVKRQRPSAQRTAFS